jgi:hypothetical protein
MLSSIYLYMKGHSRKRTERHTVFWCGGTWWIEPLGRGRHRWDNVTKMDLTVVVSRMVGPFIWIRMQTTGSPCQHGNEFLGFTKFREFLDCQRNY